tara:strand:- start:2351 stop:4111 length:1761 start_codon:yes stop_codon:yes gene_type:complete
MKILKLLNKNFLLIILSFFLIISSAYSNEPVDIWNLEKKEIDENTNIKEENINEDIPLNSIFDNNTENKIDKQIQQDETLLSKNIKVVGLYDPSENGLTIDMWSISDGKQILDLFNKIEKIKLSKDANEILKALVLTNSYYPTNNISHEEFLDSKIKWLIKYKDFDLIEEYLLKNQEVEANSKLLKFLVNEHLSNSEIKRSCDTLFKNNQIFRDDYLSKFYIYCLINENKRDEAQLQFDLKKELGFKDIFFEKKFNFLMEYEKKIDSKISEKTILDFHLSHRTSSDFKFEPSKLTSQYIWKYLSTSNLLDSLESIDLEDIDKISIIEKATHDKNYSEKELFDLYKRFQFNINQLLSVKDSYKLLSNIEGRALLYQGILITSEVGPKIDLIKTLRESFVNEGIENAFNNEMSRFLNELDPNEIPSNHTEFYNNFLNKDEKSLTKIKFNNKIIHQSKLINYFRKDISTKNIEKDLNDLLKKIKKNKNYFVSTKDIILIESLKFDGVNISKKYSKLYDTNNLSMPNDIQKLIDNNEIGMVLLRLVQIIGEDELKNIGSDTLYFIVSALNQLNIDPIRNKILLKILPLKV